MLWLLIRKEIVTNVLSARFAVTFILFFGMILVSVFVMTDHYKVALDLYEADESSRREELAKLKANEDPQQALNDLLNAGVYGHRRPRSLSIFAKGLEDNIPTQVHVHSGEVNEEFYKNALFSVFQTPDFSYVVNLVVSLLSVLFVFDAICGEKERGTLKLILSNSVPRDLIILGKWVGGYLSLIAPFLVSVFAGLLYIRISGVILLEGEMLIRLAWMLFICLLYISLFFALGMMISTLTRQSSTALLISLLVWICWILVIPNVSPVLARMIYPVPTPQKINAEKQAIGQEMALRIQRIRLTMLAYGDEASKKEEELQREVRSRNQKLDDFYADKLGSQMSVSMTISRLSPSASFRYAFTGLCGTGVSLHEHFRRAYERFREQFREYTERMRERGNKGELDRAWLKIDEIPRLTIFEERTKDTINAVLVDILLMVIYNVLFFITCYAFFLRYDVR